MNRRETLRAIGTAIGIGGIAGAGVSVNRSDTRGGDNGQDNQREAGDIRLLGEVETPGAREVEVKVDGGDRYAFVGNGELDQGPGFSVVDWSTPRSPEQIDRFDPAGTRSSRDGHRAWSCSTFDRLGPPE